MNIDDEAYSMIRFLKILITICYVNQILPKLAKLSISHRLWRMCILESRDLQAFLRIEREVSPL